MTTRKSFTAPLRRKVQPANSARKKPPTRQIVPAQRLRRWALNAQGLLGKPAFGNQRNAVLATIEHLGYVQIDTISVVERAHHHTLWARIPNYQNQWLDFWLAQRKIFEYWFHAAAYLPMRDYRFALQRMRAISDGEHRHWTTHRNTKLERKILDRIRADGPSKARDFEMAQQKRSGWWDWKPAKLALEYLFMTGQLMCAGREGFQKIYDLTERVLPAEVDTRPPSLAEFASHLIDTHIRAQGFASELEFSYGRRGRPLRIALKAEINQRLQQGALIALTTPGSEETWFAEPALLDQRITLKPRARLLSPFDNAVIHRERGIAVYNYDYQIECYVPAAKRQFGYFCLPILYGDTFVGRADCKADRKHGVFSVRHLFIETTSIDENLPAALVETFLSFAAFNGCTSLRLDSIVGAPRGLFTGALSNNLSKTEALITIEA